MERRVYCLFWKRIFTHEIAECLNIRRTIIGHLLMFCNTGLEPDIFQEDILKRCNCLSFHGLAGSTGFPTTTHVLRWPLFPSCYLLTIGACWLLQNFTWGLRLGVFLIGFKGQKQYGLNRSNEGCYRTSVCTRIRRLACNQTTILIQWQISSMLVTSQSTVTVPLW